MTASSNNNGRAYEYIFLVTLANSIRQYRCADVLEDSCYNASKKAWGKVRKAAQDDLRLGAEAAIQTLFDLEPMMVEPTEDKMILKIQSDQNGKKGDVRDIVVSRRDVRWEIGLSLKHNHFAVKHSRLSPTIDFGKKWYGVPCSQSYWKAVNPIFDYLSCEEQKKSKWSSLANKDNAVYVPVLKAFVHEIGIAKRNNPDVPRRLIEYLLGAFDFYKVISIDEIRATQIQAFNFHGKLNQPSKTRKPVKTISVPQLPTEIVSLRFKPGSTTTVEMYLNNGWQLNFRIHSASTIVETSLKFDIQIVGLPLAYIYTVTCEWQ